MLSNRTVFVFATVVTATALTSCAPRDRGLTEVAEAVARHERTVDLSAESYATVVAPSPSLKEFDPQESEPQESEPGRERFTVPGTLREYIARALQHNPEVLSARDNAYAKAERVVQAASLSDPLVMTKILPEPTRTAEGDNYFNLSISQKLPVPEKLDRAGCIALEETRAAIDRLQEVRIGVIADVKRSYFGLHLLNKTIEIVDADRGLMRNLIEAARAQVRAGKRSVADVLRGEVEFSQLDARLIELRHRRETARVALNSLLDRPTDTPIPDFDEFSIRETDYDATDLFARAIESNPRLQLSGREIEIRRQQLELARLARWPDFTLGLDWISMEPRDAFVPPRNPSTGVRPSAPQMSEDGSDNWGITFGFTLPVWVDRIDAGVRQSEHDLASARQRFAAKRNEVERQFFDAIHRYRTQQELAILFRDSIIPQAEQTYRVSLTSYTAGKTGFLDVIEDHRRWLTLQIQYYGALTETEICVADLEEVIGRSLAGLDSGD